MKNTLKEYKITQPNISFLIEGHDRDCEFAEIDAAMKLAKTNGCPYFDIISSFDITHLSAALNTDEKTQKIMVASLFEITSIDFKRLIDEAIKPSFQNLLNNGHIERLPDWIVSLDLNSLINFGQSVLDDYFEADLPAFLKALKISLKELVDLSNQISFKKLLDYLSAHPEIDVVYGLIGAAHLDMLRWDSNCHKEGIYYYTQFHIQKRTIDIHLFGGSHGNLDHYKKMAEIAGKNNLVIPKDISMEENHTKIQEIIPSPLEKITEITTAEQKDNVTSGSDGKHEPINHINRSIRLFRDSKTVAAKTPNLDPCDDAVIGKHCSSCNLF